MRTAFLIALVVALGGFAYANGAELAGRAELKNANGEQVGVATLREMPGGVLISVDIQNLPPGAHAFHIHAVGNCEPPFTSAGGHYNPVGKKHGLLNPEGPHAGDLPNIHVGSDGKVRFEVIAGQVTLGAGANSLLDGDGSALVVHEGVDDYLSDPAGNAGPRIACGVIVRK